MLNKEIKLPAQKEFLKSIKEKSEGVINCKKTENWLGEKNIKIGQIKNYFTGNAGKSIFGIVIKNNTASLKSKCLCFKEYTDEKNLRS